MEVTVKGTEGISSHNNMSHIPLILGNKTPLNSSSEPIIKGASQIALFLRIVNALFVSVVNMN